MHKTLGVAGEASIDDESLKNDIALRAPYIKRACVTTLTHHKPNVYVPLVLSFIRDVL